MREVLADTASQKQKRSARFRGVLRQIFDVLLQHAAPAARPELLQLQAAYQPQPSMASPGNIVVPNSATAATADTVPAEVSAAAPATAGVASVGVNRTGGPASLSADAAAAGVVRQESAASTATSTAEGLDDSDDEGEETYEDALEDDFDEIEQLLREATLSAQQDESGSYAGYDDLQVRTFASWPAYRRLAPADACVPTVALQELLEQERSAQLEQLASRRAAAQVAIRNRKASKLQRAWRAYKTPVAVETRAGMYLERLDKYNRSTMQRQGYCHVCGMSWHEPGHMTPAMHMARNLRFRDQFEPLFRARIVPTLVQVAHAVPLPPNHPHSGEA